MTFTTIVSLITLAIVALFLDRAWSFYRFCFLIENDDGLPVKRMKAVYFVNTVVYVLVAIQSVYSQDRNEIILTLATTAISSVVIWILFHAIGWLTEQRGLSKNTLAMLFIIAGLIPPVAIAAGVFSGKIFDLLK